MIVCEIFQFTGVKVTLIGKPVPSPVSFELKPIVTLAVGSASKTIVNVAVVPSSLVLPLIADTVIPGTRTNTLVFVLFSNSQFAF